MTQTVKLSIHTEGAINFAESCAGGSAIKHIEVKNTGSETLRGARLIVRCQGGELAGASFDVPTLAPGEKRVQSCSGMSPVPRVLHAITEEYETVIHAEVFVGETSVGCTTQGIMVHPANMWAGFKASKALASFSTPNHPSLDKLGARTAEIMKGYHGSSSLSGYENTNPSWARYQGEAAYEALREMGLNYSLPPCSFGGGQRIRLVHQVLSEGKGTCICLVFTYASQLESLGLDPVVLIYGNHAAAGFWTVKSEASRVINRDKKELLALTQGDNPKIVLVECTTLTHAGNNHFAVAHSTATAKLAERDNFEYWLDIKTARNEGGMPLPLLATPGAGSDSGQGPSSLSDGGHNPDLCPDALDEDFAEPDDLPFGPMPDEAESAFEHNLDPCSDHRSGTPTAGSGRSKTSPALAEVLEHKNNLGRNAITGALMGTPLPSAHCTVPEPAFIDPAGLATPLPADASQLHAVQHAASGKSFVLIGPPGTGKTQAIANIAADAAAHGKTVAITARSEKALDVLKERLDQACFGPHQLDLYTKGMAPAAMVAQLEKAYSFSEDDIEELLAQKNLSAPFDKDSKAGIEIERDLNAYASALERKGACGLTLREQICGYQQYRHAPNLVSVDSQFSSAATSRGAFESVLALIDNICVHVESMGNVRNHPLFSLDNIGGIDDEEPHPDKVEQRLERLEALLQAIGEAESAIPSHAQLRSWADDLDNALASAWANTRAEADFANAAEETLRLTAEAETFALQVEEMWKPSLFALSSEALSLSWESACALSPWRSRAAKRALCKELQLHAWNEVAEGDIPNAIGTLSFYESKMLAAAESLHASIPALRTSAENELKTLRLLSSESQKLHEWSVWLDCKEKATEAGLKSMVDAYEHGLPARDIADSAKKAVYHALCVESIRADASIRRFSGAMFERAISEYARTDQALKARSAHALLHGCRKHAHLALRDPQHSVQAAAFKEALQSKGHGKSIASMLEAFPDIVAALCPCVLLTPNAAAEHLNWDFSFDLLVIDEASQMETAHAIGLIERAKQVIVVGDSRQLPPTSFFMRKESAVEAGIMSRGESILDDCLIVGLPQLELNWHYRSRHESLIAFANSQFYQNRLITFPSSDDRESKVVLRRVEGPYDGRGRNRSEAQAIVDELKRRFEATHGHVAGESESADEAIDKPEGAGLEPEGICPSHESTGFEREETHLSGASSARGCSIGVITFNVQQQALVNSLLNAEFSKNDAFARWAREGRESLFVRNLENVQGDERDTILLSLTYARDANGTLSLNFGPVNKAGGERRLNVAFTRARCEMQVFTSMSSGDMVLTDAHSRGAHAMRDFLAYAEAGSGPSRSSGSSSSPGSSSASGESGAVTAVNSDAIANSLCSRLEQLGYRTKRCVGASRAKVDIAIIDPRNQNRYLAGILLDGASYSLARSTRDRELGRKQQLEDLGWNIMRMWSLDYLFDEERCVERTVAFLDRLAA